MAEKEKKPKDEAIEKTIVKNEELEEQESELMEQVEKSIKSITIDLKKPGIRRYAELKVAIRSILLRKSKQGYANRYYYIPLKHLQAAFTRLELAFGLTSMYTMKRTSLEGKIFYDATRVLTDLETNEVVKETSIDITDLILNKIEPGTTTLDYLKEVLNLKGEEPKDAWLMLFLNYFDPQKKGAYSTYFQRYTYFQLYDFQEVDYDDIEEKPQGKSEANRKEEPKRVDAPKTAKEIREEQTPELELRNKIKEKYKPREDIIKILGPERKLGTMNLEELQAFEKELEEAYPEKAKEKGE